MRQAANQSQPSSTTRINCYKCKHFYVTWDPNFPRGCRSYGIKTSELPSSLIRRSSGKPCLTFEEK
ncbi:uracil-DNA glycosylase [Paenibacillus validus]|nr:uracil-DNA glycosylase [Paenibacillus validus]MED4607664.1 uracil-DNA glycosylase [Paenibacillus validus]